MKKQSLLLTSLFLVVLTAISFDVYAQQQGQSENTNTNSNQNQNQVQTENQGDEQNLEITNEFSESEKEKEKQGSPSAKKKKEDSKSDKSNKSKAEEHMSEVAKYVQELKDIGEKNGGIGQQVKEVAQQQENGNKKIEEDLEIIQSKNKVIRFLFGTDYKALRNIEKQMEQNKQRIKKLNELKTQLENEVDQDMLYQTVTAIKQENTALQEEIQNEEGKFSLFGWLVKFFAK